jgi:hypothetical protein
MRKLVVRGLTALALSAVIGNLRGQNAGGAGARTVVEDFRLEVESTAQRARVKRNTPTSLRRK